LGIFVSLNHLFNTYWYLYTINNKHFLCHTKYFKVCQLFLCACNFIYNPMINVWVVFPLLLKKSNSPELCRWMFTLNYNLPWQPTLSHWLLSAVEQILYDCEKVTVQTCRAMTMTVLCPSILIGWEVLVRYMIGWEDFLNAVTVLCALIFHTWNLLYQANSLLTMHATKTTPLSFKLFFLIS
jgi:hypothetical protein